MKTIFYDVDTQNDFMNANGALYVPDAELIKPALAELTKYACKKGIPIFGSVDRHFGTPEYAAREKELQRNGGPFPDHCMDGTKGQEKIRETYFSTNFSRVMGYTDFPVETAFINNPLQTEKTKLRGEREEFLLDDMSLAEVIKNYIKNNTYKKRDNRGDPIDATPGIFFEKQHYDVATNHWFEKVIKAVAPKKVIVYGVATDYCVKAGVLALKKVGVPEVYVVTDLIRGITPEGSKKALEEMVAVGAKLTNLEKVLRGELK